MHEALVELFREQPTLALGLASAELGTDAVGPVRMVDSALTDAIPASYAADVVLAIGRRRPRLVIAVEVQRARDPGKRFSWPVYAWTLRARHRCPAVVLVWAATRPVAQWARGAITNGPATFRPIVVGPDDIPRVTSSAQASADLSLAALSAIAHGGSSGGRLVLAAFVDAVVGLPSGKGRTYHDVVAASLNGRGRAVLEELMTYRQNKEPLSEWARGHYFTGRAEGMAEGMAEGEARLVLRQLARRLGLLGPERQAAITALPIGALEALGEALLDFQTLDDLDGWLAARAKQP